MEQLDNYYLKKEEPNKSCLLALRNIILKQDINITETQKWGMPCFCYKKKMFCYLWTDKKTDEPPLWYPVPTAARAAKCEKALVAT